MTQEERLVFCRVCVNRKFDPNRGMVCGLTLTYPTFDGSCPDYDIGDGSLVKKAERGTDARPAIQRGVQPVDAGVRFANSFIDTIGMMVFGFLLAMVMIGTGIGMSLLEDESTFGSYIFGGLISTIYYFLLEASTGRSLGKLVTKTKVVTERGLKPDAGTFFVRTICRLIPFNAFSFLGSGVGWHDTISQTRVVHKDSIAPDTDDDILDNF